MDPTGAVARRFPLIARPRPPCGALSARIEHLCALAERAERDSDMSAASTVHNQAALIASDCGLPDLARQWCHRHAMLYLHTHPLDAPAARRALEPLVNLARLHIRDGNGDTAFGLLDNLYESVASRSETIIDSIPIPARLTATAADHRELRTWLWTVHLADGSRALASVGRWPHAYDHLRRRNGIGHQMLDGRQVAVLAHATAGDHDTALALLESTAPGEPWQEAVTACLDVLCRRHAGHPVDAHLTTMLDRYQQLAPEPRLAVFHTRLGLSVLDATGDLPHPDAVSIAVKVIQRTLAFGDGYSAHDVLAHPGCIGLLTEAQTRNLREILDSSALGCQRIPDDLHAHLLAAVVTAEAVLARLTDRPRGPRGVPAARQGQLKLNLSS